MRVICCGAWVSEQRRRMIGGPPLFQRRNTTKAKLAKIKAFNESVNRRTKLSSDTWSSSMAGKSVLWLRSIPSTKPDIRRSRPPI